LDVSYNERPVLDGSGDRMGGVEHVARSVSAVLHKRLPWQCTLLSERSANLTARRSLCRARRFGSTCPIRESCACGAVAPVGGGDIMISMPVCVQAIRTEFGRPNFQRAVEDMDSDLHLGRPALVRARAQPVTNHLLEARHTRLGSGALDVAWRCLSGHAAVLGDWL